MTASKWKSLCPKRSRPAAASDGKSANLQQVETRINHGKNWTPINHTEVGTIWRLWQSSFFLLNWLLTLLFLLTSSDETLGGRRHHWTSMEWTASLTLFEGTWHGRVFCKDMAVTHGTEHVTACSRQRWNSFYVWVRLFYLLMAALEQEGWCRLTSPSHQQLPSEYISWILLITLHSSPRLVLISIWIWHWRVAYHFLVCIQWFWHRFLRSNSICIHLSIISVVDHLIGKQTAVHTVYCIYIYYMYICIYTYHTYTYIYTYYIISIIFHTSWTCVCRGMRFHPPAIY